MKKILLSLAIVFALLFANVETQAQVTGTVQGGYSWLNGMIGAELQFANLGVSGGYYPARMPGSGDPISSFSAAATWYGKPYEDCLYGSIGIASAGYRYEVSYNSGPYGDAVVLPMTIGMIGYKAHWNDWRFKLGGGYGWCSEAGVFTWEILIGYSFGQ